MNLLNLLGPTNSSITVPSFEQGEKRDSIDLQIKSLLYLFKRLRINKLSPFLDENHDFKYTDHKTPSIEPDVAQFYEKLDQTYGTKAFEAILKNDAYRVMVDFTKNKFRSYCILSDHPSPNLSRPSSPVKGASTSLGDAHGDSIFPSFQDYRDRRVKGYKFVLFPLTKVSIHDVANILAGSDIYLEHHGSFDFATRYQFASESVKEIIKSERFTTSKVTDISENEKQKIIRGYLKKISFNVQLSRIYESYVKSVESPTKVASPTKQADSSPTRVKAKSPVKQLSVGLSELSLSAQNLPENHSLNGKPFLPPVSPTRLASKKSIANLRSSRPTSPIKEVKNKPSISQIKLDQLYNPVASPPMLQEPFSDFKSESSQTSENSSTQNDHSGITEIRLDIYEKCKLAVLDKLNKEKKKISSSLTS